jgi:hypothetical protein
MQVSCWKTQAGLSYRRSSSLVSYLRSHSFSRIQTPDVPFHSVFWRTKPLPPRNSHTSPAAADSLVDFASRWPLRCSIEAGALAICSVGPFRITAFLRS